MPQAAPQHWYRFVGLVDDDEVEEASTQLWTLGAAGVEVRDRETFVDDESAPPLPEGRAEVEAFFCSENSVDPSTWKQRVTDAFVSANVPLENPRAYAFTDTSWKTSWKDYFQPLQLSPRSVVGPPWESFEAPGDSVSLVIEPGLAFGTGSHETTQLSATFLDARLEEIDGDADVLDVGCGSAILSMLASRLGARRVVGVDIDESALEVARENLDKNQLTGRVELTSSGVDTIEETFDVVVANILSHVLIDIREHLRERVRVGGWLILSGATSEQIEDLQRAFGGEGWRQTRIDDKNGWAALEFQKPTQH